VTLRRCAAQVISSFAILRSGIIFGLSNELTEFHVASEIKAEDVRRMVKRNGSGNIARQAA